MWPFLQTPNSACGCSSQSGTNQCGCDKISSLDVSYNGPALVCSGIELCDSLTVALQKIEEKICTAGTVSGSGTVDYLARWSPNSFTLSTGLIRDNGVSTAINTAPNSDALLRMQTTTHSYVQYTFLARISNDNNIGIRNLTFGSTDTNIGIQGIGSGKDNNVNIGINGIGSGINDDAGTATTIGGKFEAYDTNLGNSYAVQLYDGSQGIGKFLKSITNDGHANWANITTADITGFPSSVVGGSGTLNYVARWTPDGNTLGVGLIQDNNDTISIGATLDPNIFMNILASKPYGAILLNTNTTNVITSGISAQTNGVNTQENRGIEAYASNSTSVNTAFRGAAVSNSGGKAVGGHFIANGSGVNYSVRLSDGTQALNKVLTCVTINGEANWNSVSSDYTTGATGSFISQDGKTITVTNGLITSIV